MTTVANDFSQNMFSTSTNHINTPLYVRVGGISQDNSMFDLYAVSIGASHVNMQLVSRAPFSACQPVTDAKMNQKKGTGHNVIEAVLGSFYGLVMIRDFIASAGELRVKQLHPPEGSSTTYMGYERVRLVSTALFDLELWRTRRVLRGMRGRLSWMSRLRRRV